jgi:hypothetical protein
MISPTAYAGACAASVNVTLDPLSIRLTLPKKWDGPAALPLSTGVTVLALLFGVIFGGGAILVLSNM